MSYEAQRLLTDLPTSATGLEVGALYNDSGTVKVKTHLWRTTH